MLSGVLVLDDGWRIINEYTKQLKKEDQPGPGSAFLKWVLTNWANPERCILVHIEEAKGGDPVEDFLQFPVTPELRDFDPSDRKFVAVAIVHPEHPPIWNAVDSDWHLFEKALKRVGVSVTFLCGKP
jgi:hypothetical protein